MDKTVSFRTDVKKIEALDAIAEAQDRDRSYLLNEAIDHYLEVQQYHIESIKRGILDADAGRLIEDGDIERVVHKLRRRK